MDKKRERQFRELGLTIAYYRKLKGMTQLQLAEAADVSRTHMSNIEAPNGKTSVSLEKLFDIADALDVPVKDLFDLRKQAMASPKRGRIPKTLIGILPLFLQINYTAISSAAIVS